MTDENLNILLQHAARERDLIEGHARELNAAAELHESLIATLIQLKDEKSKLIDENTQLKKENIRLNSELQNYQNAPKQIVNNFNAPIGNNIQHADAINLNKHETYYNE